MPPTPLPPREADATAFPELLRSWRLKRRLSQMDLALESGVSQRHLSFLESGRARPSRAMILELTETLAVPLRERNGWLLAAGFAPVFRARGLDDPQMAQVMGAVRMMLANHEPFPAVALWHRIRREAEALGALGAADILAETERHLDADALRMAEDEDLVPVLPLVIEKDGLRVSFFTVIATFGMPQDVTADELRIESLFPADPATERLFRGTS